MTIINPNSISGISSITALNSTAAINLFKADGTSANIIAGVVTATSFGSISGTTGTFSGNIDVTGDLDVDGHTNLDNVSIVGVTTITGTLLALNSNSANPAIVKLQTNTNSCEIEARKVGGENNLVLSSNNSTDHLVISGTAVQLPNDDQRLEIGANQELKIAQDGTHNITYMQNVGPLQLQTDDLRLYNYSTDDLYLRAQTNAGVSLYYDYSTYSTAKLSTTATGVTIDGTAVAGGLDISGDIDVDGHTNLDNVSIAGITTVSSNLVVTGQIFQSRPNDLWTTGSAFYEIAGLGNLTTQGSYETTLTSNGYRDTNAQWVSYATNSYTGASQIRLNPQGSIIFGAESSKSNGSTHVVTERLRIDQEGIRSPGGTFNIRNNSSTGNVTINVLGVSGDSRIDLENTGNGNYSGIDFIRERSSGTGVVGGSIFMKSDTSSNDAYLYIQAQSASAQSPVTTALSADNGVRLKLQGGDGIFAIETGASERFKIDNNGKTNISVNKDSTALVIDGTSSGTYFGETGGRIEFLMNNEVNQFTGNFAARIAPYLDRSNNGFGLKFDVRYNANTTYKALDITSDYEVLPGLDNTIDLGNTSYRWKNIYTADLHCSNEGSKNDVDGTWGDYTIQEGESDLFLINNRSGKKYKFNLTEVS